METKGRVYRGIVVASLLLLYAVLISFPISMVRSDLGRHLKNGEVILRTHAVPSTNYYSYTYPDFPFVNHHWGSGVIFFLTEQAFGFVGLSVLLLAVSLLTFWFFFRTAWKASSFELAVASSLAFMPLMMARLDIRPEMFSYLFMGAFFWLLVSVRRGDLDWKWLLLLPVSMCVWVNLHIYHFFGLFLIGVFWLESVLDSRVLKKPSALAPRGLFTAGAASALVTLVNPLGLKGALYPLRIFEKYGYTVFENQSVVFMLQYANYPAVPYYIAGVVILVASMFLVARRIARREEVLAVSNHALAVTFGCLAFFMVRNFTAFAYFGFALAAMNLGSSLRWRPQTLEGYYKSALAFVAVFGLTFASPSFWQGRGGFGLGLDRDTLSAANFLIEEGIEGPIFNNYDTGSYLIHALFPGQRVFVDNRPEAYPVEFFEQEYIPMQEDGEAWKRALVKYDFNAIVFNHTDTTSWGQEFLIARVNDPEWAPVFVGREMIILLRNVAKNRGTIERYPVPREMFGEAGSATGSAGSPLR